MTDKFTPPTNPSLPAFTDTREAVEAIMKLSGNNDRELVRKEVQNLIERLEGDRMAKQVRGWTEDELVEASKRNFSSLYEK